MLVTEEKRGQWLGWLVGFAPYRSQLKQQPKKFMYSPHGQVEYLLVIKDTNVLISLDCASIYLSSSLQIASWYKVAFDVSTLITSSKPKKSIRKI